MSRILREYFKEEVINPRNAPQAENEGRKRTNRYSTMDEASDPDESNFRSCGRIYSGSKSEVKTWGV